MFVLQWKYVSHVRRLTRLVELSLVHMPIDSAAARLLSKCLPPRLAVLRITSWSFAMEVRVCVYMRVPKFRPRWVCITAC